MAAKQKRVRNTGPYSSEGAITSLRARTKEARFLNEIRDQLTEHVGGRPSPVQKLLIERIAMTMLRIELMDAEALKRGRPIRVRQSRDYLAWTNSIRLMLQHLGFEGRTPKPSTSFTEFDFDIEPPSGVAA